MEALDYIFSDEWYYNLGFWSSVKILHMHLSKDASVQKVAAAFPEQLTPEYLQEFIERNVKAHFNPETHFCLDEALAALAVALENHKDHPFVKEYFDGLLKLLGISNVRWASRMAQYIMEGK